MSNFFIFWVFLTYYTDVAIIIMLLFIQVVFNLNGFTYYLHSQTKHMVDIFGMTLDEISRPFNIKSLKLFQFCCFFLQLLLDMYPFMQILFKMLFVLYSLQKKFENFSVTSRSFQGRFKAN